MEAQGINGKLVLGKGYVEIVRKGFMSFMTQGFKGNKKIAIKQISAIQFKPAGFITNGYIQFSFIGGQESKRGIFMATQDENTLMFNKKQQSEFEKIKEQLEKHIYSWLLKLINSNHLLGFSNLMFVANSEGVFPFKARWERIKL